MNPYQDSEFLTDTQLRQSTSGRGTRSAQLTHGSLRQPHSADSARIRAWYEQQGLEPVQQGEVTVWCRPEHTGSGDTA